MPAEAVERGFAEEADPVTGAAWTDLSPVILARRAAKGRRRSSAKDRGRHVGVDKYYKKVLHRNMTKQIEFDPSKDAKNWAKHKIHLATAALVFADPMRIERIDDSSSDTSGEEHWQTLGKVGGVLFVVYTERGEKIRLISARPASKAEKRSYYGFDPTDSKRWTNAD